MFERLLKKGNEPKHRNGKWKEFSKHATMLAEGNYINDVKHGTWKQYYESGELLIEESYDHGVLHGRYTTFHKNGQLKVTPAGVIDALGRRRNPALLAVAAKRVTEEIRLRRLRPSMPVSSLARGQA